MQQMTAVNADYEPEYPAVIHAPNHPCEPLLIAIPNWQVFVERMNDHWSPGPDHWRRSDRLIDASGQVYSIAWGGPDDETGGDYFIAPIDETVSADEMMQLLKDHHEYLERKPNKYIDHIETIDSNSVVWESIAYVSTLPRCRPIFSPQARSILFIAATILVLIVVVAVIMLRN